MHSLTEMPHSSDAPSPTDASYNPAPHQQAHPARKLISSRTLLEGLREIEIDHGGQLYRLRVTALGKLILTK